jgi:hypothetical protein
MNVSGHLIAEALVRPIGSGKVRGLDESDGIDYRNHIIKPAVHSLGCEVTGKDNQRVVECGRLKLALLLKYAPIK